MSLNNQYVRSLWIYPVLLMFWTGCAPILPHDRAQNQTPKPTPSAKATTESPEPGDSTPLPYPSDAIPLELPLGKPVTNADSPSFPDLERLFQKALDLTSDGQYERAGDQLFALQDQALSLSPAPADTAAQANLSSLSRRQVLLGAILTELQATRESGVACDSLLTTGYAALTTSGFPDSLVPATGMALDEMTADLLVINNSAVREWEDYFRGRGHQSFQLWLNRKSAADSLISTILADENLPPQLIYLAMIESGLSSRAVSSAGAVGPWQFMPGTAKDYGLKINWWLDERRDLETSTRAAAHYLTVLHNRFGNWALTLAAYNGGGGLMSRKIRQHGHDNFWEMRLPSQTTGYVPKFIAAAHIGEDPITNGFTSPPSDPAPSEVLPVNSATDLALIARCAGVPLDVITALNPALLRGATPPDSKQYPVRIPKGTKRSTARKLAAIPADKRLTWRQHRVQRGETLGGIAQKYGTSAAAIGRMNKMKNLHLIRPGDELLIPMPTELVGKARQRAAEKGHYVPPSGYKRVSYRVKAGDTLGGIAQKLHVSIRHLRKVNNIHHTNLIHPGDRIFAYRPR